MYKKFLPEEQNIIRDKKKKIVESKLVDILFEKDYSLYDLSQSVLSIHREINKKLNHIAYSEFPIEPIIYETSVNKAYVNDDLILTIGKVFLRNVHTFFVDELSGEGPFEKKLRDFIGVLRSNIQETIKELDDELNETLIKIRKNDDLENTLYILKKTEVSENIGELGLLLKQLSEQLSSLSRDIGGVIGLYGILPKIKQKQRELEDLEGDSVPEMIRNFLRYHRGPHKLEVYLFSNNFHIFGSDEELIKKTEEQLKQLIG